jgi:DNA-binding NarL/FixJ family response regulator
VEHIYAKLGVSNRAGAAMHAMHHGIVSYDTRGDARVR